MYIFRISMGSSVLVGKTNCNSVYQFFCLKILKLTYSFWWKPFCRHIFKTEYIKKCSLMTLFNSQKFWWRPPNILKVFTESAPQCCWIKIPIFLLVFPSSYSSNSSLAWIATRIGRKPEVWYDSNFRPNACMQIDHEKDSILYWIKHLKKIQILVKNTRTTMNPRNTRVSNTRFSLQHVVMFRGEGG